MVLSHVAKSAQPVQAFYEVTLDPIEAYLDDLRKSGSTHYVLISDPIALNESVRTFSGKLYRDQKTVVSARVKVTVTRCIYFHDFADDKPVTELTYLAFASDETEYLVHKLAQASDFIQILSATVSTADAALMQQAQEISFRGVANQREHRLGQNRNLAGEMQGRKIQIHTGKQLI